MIRYIQPCPYCGCPIDIEPTSTTNFRVVCEPCFAKLWRAATPKPAPPSSEGEP